MSETPTGDSPTDFEDKGFGALIGVRYTEVTGDRVRATWTLRPELWQPFGIVHGGVHCAVIEGMASLGGAVWFGDRGHVVGVNNNTDFVRAVRDGDLFGEALPIHRGRTQQLWAVTITDERDKLVARGQVRLANIADTASIGH